MANEERIDEFISPKAIKQFAQLDLSIEKSQAKLMDLAEAAMHANEALGKTKSIKDYSKANQDAAISAEKLAQETLKTEAIILRNAALKKRAADQAVKDAEREQKAIDKKRAAEQKANKEQNSAAGSVDQMRARLARLTAAYNSLSAAERNNAAIGGVQLKALKALDAEIKDVAQSMGNYRDSVGNYGKAMQGLTTVFKGALAFFAVDKLVSFGKEIFNVTAEFQKLSAVLTNTLGSQSLANKALSDIEQFAAVTPYGVAELTDSFVKLANQGVRPSMGSLRQLGDLASSAGKSFDQLTEALIDARTGEFERLKEFGIRASKEGDKVTFAFKGVKTQVDFTSASITDYITSLGDLEGVSGGMATISKTMAGQVSNIGDETVRLFKTIGDQTTGLMAEILGATSKGLAALTKAVRNEEQIMADNTAQYIDRVAKRIDESNNDELRKRVEFGEKRADVEREIFERTAKEAEELSKRIEENNIERQEQISTDLIELERRKQAGLYGAEFNSIQKRVQENKKLQRVYEAEYEAQIYLRDEYYARIKDIDQRAAAEAEKEAKERAEREKKRLDDLYLLQKQRLEFARDAQKEVSNDLNNDLDTRLSAEKSYYSKQRELAKLAYENDLRDASLSANGKLRLKEKYNNDIDKFNKEEAKSTAKIALDSYRKAEEDFDKFLSRQERRRVQNLKNELIIIETARDNELASIVGNTEEANNKRIAIEQKYTKLYISEQLKQTEAALVAARARAKVNTEEYDKVIALEKELAELRRKNNEADLNDSKKTEQEKFDLLKERANATNELFQAALSAVQAVSDSYYNKQFDAIEQTRAANDTRYNEEQKAIERKAKADEIAIKLSSDTEEEKERKLLELEKEKQAQSDIIEKQKLANEKRAEEERRQASIRKARTDKAIAILSIVSSTAMAVMNQLGGGDPYTAFARAAAAGIIGATQLALTVAQPIPAYEEGGVHPHDGPALYSEKGKEIAITPDGNAYWTPDKPTISHVKKGTEFISNKDWKRMVAMDKMGSYFSKASNTNIDLKPLLNSYDKNSNKMIKAMKSKQPITVNNGRTITYKTHA